MNTRDRIVAAAAEVMRTRGLARATTKEIAKAAGFSEAALYKHFRDKTELFVAVLGERGPTRLSRVFAELPNRLGQDPVEEVLRDVTLAAADFYEQTFPMAASLFAEPKVLDAHRAALRERGNGPHQVCATVATYLKEEQALGRINADVDPHAAAGMVLGACLERAFLSHFIDAEDRPSTEDFAARLVDALLSGISVK